MCQELNDWRKKTHIQTNTVIPQKINISVFFYKVNVTIRINIYNFTMAAAKGTKIVYNSNETHIYTHIHTSIQKKYEINEILLQKTKILLFNINYERQNNNDFDLW